MPAKKKNSEASRRGRANRNKGKVYERDVANALKCVYPEAKRGIGQARTGAERPDVIGTPWWIEVGTGQTIKIHDKLRQAFNDSACSDDAFYAGKPVMIFTKSVRGENVVSMERADFIALLVQMKRTDERLVDALAELQVRRARHGI